MRLHSALMLITLIITPFARCMSAHAQTSETRHTPMGRIHLSIDSSEVLIGSPFEITGIADIPKGAALRAPAENEDLQKIFEILSVKFGKPKIDGERKALPITIRLSAFALGEQNLPAMAWTLMRRDGSSVTLESPPVHVTVTPPPPNSEDSGDIRNIKDPLAPVFWPWILSGVILLVIIAAAIYYYAWGRHAAHPVKTAAPKDTRSFEEMALQDIDALSGLTLAPKDFFDRLSDIVRMYIERRCLIRALQMTSHDLLKNMMRAKLVPEARTQMKTLLAHCDLAKFAKHHPEKSQYTSDCDIARSIIGLLKPPPPQTAPTHDLAAGAPKQGGL